MKLVDSNAYYADRAVEHTAQGDIYAGIPLVQATRTGTPRTIGRVTPRRSSTARRA